MSSNIKPTGKLQVQFAHNVTRDHVVAAIEEVFRVTGCLTCGIRGIEIRLSAGDPAPEVAALRALPGVAGVTEG